MLILLHGQDTFRSRRRLHQLEAAFRQKHDPSGLNTLRLDGETMQPDQFNASVFAGGFLAKLRFIAIMNVLTNGKANVQEAVQGALEAHAFTTDNIVVFWESDDMSEVRTTKKKVAAGEVLRASMLTHARREQFAVLDAGDVQDWIEREVKQRGGAIEKKAATQLAASVGIDLWRASAEIDKLVAYADGHIITEADITQLVPAEFSDTAFALTDALGAGDRQRALQVLEQQLNGGTDVFSILRMLGWHIRTLLGVRSMMDEGITAQQTIARELGIHPFVAGKAVRTATTFSTPTLAAFAARLTDIELQLKTRRVNPSALLELLAVEMTRG